MRSQLEGKAPSNQRFCLDFLWICYDYRIKQKACLDKILDSYNQYFMLTLYTFVNKWLSKCYKNEEKYLEGFFHKLPLLYFGLRKILHCNALSMYMMVLKFCGASKILKLCCHTKITMESSMDVFPCKQAITFFCWIPAQCHYFVLCFSWVFNTSRFCFKVSFYKVWLLSFSQVGVCMCLCLWSNTEFLLTLTR